MKDNNTKNNSLFIIATGTIISLARVILAKLDGNDDSILIIMAVINYVSFGFVILFLDNDLKYDCIMRINKSGFNTKVKEKSRFIINILSTFFVIIYLGLGFLYLRYLKNETCNDVISIFALSISIASAGVVKEYGKLYYKVVLKAVNYMLKTK